MVGKPLNYASVPTSVELENNSNQTRYTVNKSPKGDLSISRPACALFVMGALLLAAVAAVVTFFLLPRCDSHSTPESLRKNEEVMVKDSSVVEYVRLPRSIEPTHYRINILPFLYGNFSTQGNVTITLRIKEDTSKISLNAKDLDVVASSVSVVDLGRNASVKITKQDNNPEKQIYSIELEGNLLRDQNYQITMDFVGHLNDYMVGFYRSHYVDGYNTTRWLASTQFSPTDARRAFPCFDEPSFKANFTISVARPINMLSLSNMPKKDSLALLNENLAWDNYEETPPMSSYLVAFAVLDFVPYRHNSSGKLFTIWTTQSSQQHTSYAINLGPRILQYYEDFFNLTYPLPKIDIVAIPDFGFSAMENWGLITFRESKLLFDVRTSTIDIKRQIALILSHELAHQWFGNLVTPSWWDDLWLKEGFATYFEYLGTNHVEPSWKITNEFYFYETTQAFKLDNLQSSRPIHFEVQNSDGIRQAFDAISYSKGAALIKMMHNFLGEKTFKEGLKRFLIARQFANANHDDLWEALTQQAHDDQVLKANESVNQIMDAWLHQPGFPVVDVTADYANNSIRLTQKRFFLHGKDEEDKTKWWIPLWITTSDKPSFGERQPDAWMKGETDVTLNLTLKKWYLLNFNQAGYYIVNYDERNWRVLIETIMNVPAVMRANLISDSMDLARAGLLDYDIPLKIIEFMGARDRNIDFVPTMTVFEKLNFLHDMLKSTPAFGNFEAFVAASYSFAFDNVRFDDAPGDNYLVQRIRRVVLEWACKKQESGCTIESRVSFRNWMTDGIIIRPNLRDVIYCTALREEGEAQWNFAYNVYLKSKSASEKETLLQALGCSSKEWLLARYLNMLVQNNTVIRKQDGALVFSSIARNFAGRNLAFNFLRTNWQKINDYYGVAFGTVRKMVESLTVYMHTDFELKELEDFKNENKNNLGTTEQAFEHAIEAVKTNIKWVKMNYQSVETWLNNRMSPYG